jgi:regulator of replication initiation timing
MIPNTEIFKLNLENQQLRKELAKEKIERAKLEQDYAELVEFVQRKVG